jgi:hypothetical protein
MLLSLPLAHRYLPLPDWPQHLAQDAIVARQNQPQFGTDLYYQTTGWFLPYQGFRLLHRVACVLVSDVIVAGALCLALALALNVAAIGWICQLLGRPWWVLASCFVVMIEGNFLWGFAPYVLGTALQWWQLALLLWWLAQPRRPQWALALNVLLGGGLFFTHIQPTFVSALLQAAVLWCAVRQRRVRWQTAAWWLVSVLPQLLLMGVYLLHSGWLAGSNLTGDFAMRPSTVWHPLWRSLAWLPIASGLTALSPLPWWLYLTVLFVLLVRSRLWLAADERSALERTQDQQAKSIVFVLLMLALVLPAEFRGQSMGPRVTSSVLLALLWLWRPHPYRRSMPWVFVLCAAATIVYTHWRFAEFSRRVAVLDRMATVVEPRSRVASLVYQPMMDGYRLPVMLHLSAYLLVAKGGMSSTGFTRTGVTFRASVPREVLTVQRMWRPYTHGEQLLRTTHGRYYDYVFVVRGPLYRGVPFSDAASDVIERLQVHDRTLELWRVTRDDGAHSSTPTP